MPEADNFPTVNYVEIRFLVAASAMAAFRIYTPVKASFRAAAFRTALLKFSRGLNARY